jgi:hypothetical protein
MLCNSLHVDGTKYGTVEESHMGIVPLKRTDRVSLTSFRILELLDVLVCYKGPNTA